MRNLFIGMMFVFLDFNLTFNSCVIGLLPDFIGYFFIMKGLQELEGRSMYFDMVKGAATGMMVYSAVLYAMDIFTISARLGILPTILGLFSMAGRLYTSYYVVLGVGDLEKANGCRMESAVLFSRWKIMAILNVASIVFMMIPFVNLIYLIAMFVVTVMYLAAFNKASNAYLWHMNQ